MTKWWWGDVKVGDIARNNGVSKGPQYIYL